MSYPKGKPDGTLLEQVQHHCNLYYNGSPELSDAEYDKLKRRLEEARKVKFVVMLEELTHGIQTLEDYRHLTADEIIKEVVTDLMRFHDIKAASHPVLGDVEFDC